MKKYLYLILLLFSFGLFVNQVHAQAVNAMSVTPAVPLSCNPIQVGMDMTQFCINHTLNSSSFTVTGSTIHVTVVFTGGPVCQGALSFPSQTTVLTGIPAGTYTLVGRTTWNGTYWDSTSTVITITSCCSANTGFASSSTPNLCPGDTLDFTSNDPNLVSYNWKLNGLPVSSANQTTQVFSMPGNYTVTLIGADTSCTDSTSRTVVVSDYPQLSFPGVVGESCPTRMDGSVDLSVTAGFAPYTYSWSSGASTQDLSQLSGGTYIVTVADSFGCSSIDSVVVPTGAPVTSSFTSSAAIVCTGETVTLTNTTVGGSNYNWIVNGVPFSTAMDTSYTVGAAGTYDIMLVASSTTCFDTSMVTLTASASPDVLFSTTPQTCKGAGDGAIDMLVATGNAPFTYSWSNGDTTEDISQLAGGTYVVTVTDSIGCQTTDSAVVTTGMGITANFTFNTSTSICPGTTVSFTDASSGGSQYSWFDGPTRFAQGAISTYTFDTGGIYDISLVISDGLCMDTAFETFTVFDAPVLAGTTTDETCPGDGDGAVNLMVSGGAPPFIYSWSNGITMQDISGLDPGAYDILIRDLNGCEFLDTFEIVTLGGLRASFTTTSSGFTTQFNDFSDTTAVSWLWDLGDGTTSTMQSPMHTFGFNGSYVVCLTATDQYGCSDMICDTLVFTVGIDPALVHELNFYPNPVTNQGFLDLSEIAGYLIELSLVDAMGRQVYSWKGIAKNEMILDMNALSTGIYGLRVKKDDSIFYVKVVKK